MIHAKVKHLAKISMVSTLIYIHTLPIFDSYVDKLWILTGLLFVPSFNEIRSIFRTRVSKVKKGGSISITNGP